MSRSLFNATWHLQVALPCHSQAAAAQGQFEAAGLGPGSYDDAVLNAHRDLGLVSHVGPSNDRHALSAVPLLRSKNAMSEPKGYTHLARSERTIVLML